MVQAEGKRVSESLRIKGQGEEGRGIQGLVAKNPLSWPGKCPSTCITKWVKKLEPEEEPRSENGIGWPKGPK